MQHFGLFTPAGLRVTSEIWGSVEYSDTEDHHDAYQLTERLLERLHTEGLILETAKGDDMSDGENSLWRACHCRLSRHARGRNKTSDRA